MRKKPHLIGMTAFVLAVVAVQLLASACHREYYLTQLIVAAYYSIVALGLCLVMGYAGQISLGHGAFFAIGGYTSAVLTTLDLGKLANTDFGQLLCRLRFLVPRQDLYGGEFVGVSPPAAFVIAILLTVVTALAIGYPALRLKGHYLAMATLGFGLIVYRILVGSEFTGGADGISSVPNWHLLPGLVICEKNGMRLQNYYFAWVVVGVTLIFILKLVNSRVGRALRSIHGNELAANAMGINTAGYKLQIFVLSAVLAATAGSLFTHYYGSIGPSEAGAMHSVRYVALVAVGGMANVWGVLTVSTILTFLSLRGCFGSYDDAVFGAILIFIMTLAPEGPLQPLARGAGMLVRRLRGEDQEAVDSEATGE